MNNIEINFDEKELAFNSEKILQASTSSEAEVVQEAYKILNESIDIFIKEYNIAYEKINFFQKKLKEVIKNWHIQKNSLKKNGEEYKDSSQYLIYLNERKQIMSDYFTDDLKSTTMNIYLLAFKIQECLNAALGQKVVTAYVFQQQGEIAPQVLMSTNMEDFLKVQVSSSGNLVLRYREDQDNLNNHIQQMKQIVQTDNNDQANYHKLVIAYNKAHTRYKNHPLEKKSGAYVLWRYPYGGQKWNGAYVSSFGSVNESYAYFLLNLRQFNPSNLLQEDMEIFMSYLITNVTNESGLLAGDFQNGIMEVAVKSADASVLGIKQIYNLVTQLKKQKINNFQEIVNFLKKKKNQNENKAKPINKSLKDSLQYIGNKYLGSAVQSLTK